MSVEFTIFPRSESPGFLIYRAAARLKCGLRRAFQAEGFDLTTEQWAVLSTLWESNGVHQSRVAEKTAKDRHNIARIVNLLEKSGLVRREPDCNDKRWRRVYLTSEGWALKPKLVGIASDFLQEALKGVTQEDLESVRRVLGRVLENLGESPETADEPPCERAEDRGGRSPELEA